MVYTAIRFVVLVLSRLAATSGKMMVIGCFYFGGETPSNSEKEDLVGDARSESDSSAAVPTLRNACFASSFFFRESPSPLFEHFVQGAKSCYLTGKLIVPGEDPIFLADHQSPFILMAKIQSGLEFNFFLLRRAS